jgi:hypothetical protein
MPGRGVRKTEAFLTQAAIARQRVPSVLEAIAGAEFVLARSPEIGTAVPGKPLKSLPIHPEDGITYKVIYSFDDREVVFQALYPAVPPGFRKS